MTGFRTGIIRDTARLLREKGIDRRPWRTRIGPAPNDRIELGADVEPRRRGGIWYRFRLGETIKVPADDDRTGLLAIPYPHQRRRYDQPPADTTSHWRRVIGKRQLGKAELKKHKLKNRPG